MRPPHFLVVNRYDDEDADYQRYCAGTPCRLSYVTRRDCVDGLVDHAGVRPGDVECVDELALEPVLAAARILAERKGPFDGVVALSEYDVLTAAQLRDAFGVPGPDAELVRGFRDKVVMKERVAAAGIAVPRYLPVDVSTSARAIVEEVGLPVVLKPRARAASAGVHVLDDERELAERIRVDAASAGLEGIECEEYISAEIYHVDGLMQDAQAWFVSVSGYVNTPLDFVRGVPLGSVLLDASPLREQLRAFAICCLHALGMVTGCFHLEVVRRSDGTLVFLEAGMRPGGAEVPALHREVFGVDLMAESFRAALGLPRLHLGDAPAPAAAGWVIFPEPGVVPSRAVRSRSMRQRMPHVRAEFLPGAAEIFDGRGGYWHLPGRFRLTGPDERAVRASVLQVMGQYRVDFEQVRADLPPNQKDA